MPPYIGIRTDAISAGFPKRGWQNHQGRAVSSAVEHYVDIVVATGSIPVPPTIFAPPDDRGYFVSRRRRGALSRRRPMKVVNSLRSLKNRHRDCQVVRRKGRIYVINKTNRRFKARQG